MARRKQRRPKRRVKQKTQRRKGQTRKRRRQRGGKVDIQNLLSKTGIEFHWPGYQYLGPGTKLEKRLARGDPGINRMDKLAKQHDIDYSRARNLRDKHKADTKMVKEINKFKNKRIPERVTKRIMQGKLLLGV